MSSSIEFLFFTFLILNLFSLIDNFSDSFLSKSIKTFLTEISFFLVENVTKFSGGSKSNPFLKL